MVFKVVCIFVVYLITIISGLYPFVKKLKTNNNHDFPIGEAIAVGVFLGAGLLHMLNDASQIFYSLNIIFPFAPFIAGLTFLLLLLLDHISREIYYTKGISSYIFVVLAVIMLSIHSFLTGTALGLSNSLSISIIIFLAIVAHKWAESFSLSVKINKSNISFKFGVILFLVFSFMLPIGVISGITMLKYLSMYPLVKAVITSLSAGTFIYLGTLHGLDKSVMVKECCNLKLFTFVIIGFLIMTIVAIWT